MREVWSKDKDLELEGFTLKDTDISNSIDKFSGQIALCSDVAELLLIEARLTKNLYKIAANRTKQGTFTRNHENLDNVNAFLSHGNYLAYGLAASTLWVLGIPHGFAVLHGKTRRGALVFDVADLIKDTLILPWAFICAKEHSTEKQFRQQCLQNFADHKALDFMFNVVKQISNDYMMHNIPDDQDGK